MKRYLIHICLALLVAAPLATMARYDWPEKLVTADQLPAAAQKFLETHFKGQPVISVEKNMVMGDLKALLKDGTQVEFAKSGVLVGAEAPKGKALPASIINALPDPISAYLKTNYPGAAIRDLQLEDKQWKLEIDKVNYELIFDNKGNYLGADD